MARHGDGLPAHVLPVEVNEITQIGPEALAGAFAYGAAVVRFLLRSKPQHDLSGLVRTITLIQAVVAGLGFDGSRIDTIETDDPDALGDSLRGIAALNSVVKSAGSRRSR